MEEVVDKLHARIDALDAQILMLRTRLAKYEPEGPEQHATDALVEMDVEESSRGTKRKTSHPLNITTASTATSNRFGPLEDLDEPSGISTATPTAPISATPMTTPQPSSTKKKRKKTAEPGPSEEEAGTQEPAVLSPRDKIPPVMLHSAQRWTSLSTAFRTRGISYLKAKTTSEGIRVEPASIDDFRAMTAFLEKEGVAFHSYTPPSEKTTRVVIRGLPADTSTDEIAEGLQEQGVKAVKVSRMKSHRTKRDLPLFLVETPAGTSVTISRLCGLVVKIEAPHRSTDVAQCHRCQGFFHSQKNCRAPPKCVKCAGAHLTKDCPVKDRKHPARCANCDADHTANYRGCTSFPKRKTHGSQTRTTPAPKPNKAASAKKPVSEKTRPVPQVPPRPPKTASPAGRSYAEATRPTPQVSRQAPDPLDWLTWIATSRDPARSANLLIELLPQFGAAITK